jgi:small nuclear ribonucleoprotein (snRNP)-like protein
MNLVLREAQEFVGGQAVRDIPLTILRGDNVIYISP